MAEEKVTHDYDCHLGWLIPMIESVKPNKILELGTDIGESSRIFLSVLEKTDGHLYTVDIKDCRDVFTDNPRVTVYTQDTTTFPWTDSVDILYIDDHVEGMDIAFHVLNELTRFGKCVRPGGLILIHDSCHSVFGPGITKAVRSYCQMNHLLWSEDSNGYGMICIPVGHAL